MAKNKKQIPQKKKDNIEKAPIIIIIVLAVIALFIAAVAIYNFSSRPKNKAPIENIATEEPVTPEVTPQVTKTPSQTAEVETEISKANIEMEDGGKILIELYPQYAPQTVANFKSLVSKGFYDGLTFHRVISGFMIQGGDPEGTGMGGSDKNIPGEFSSNGFTKNTLKHTRGVISMARSNSPDSASSQFFIMHQDNSSLDGNYAAFGKVIEGIEQVDKIAAVETDNSDKPLKPVKIKTIRIVE